MTLPPELEAQAREQAVELVEWLENVELTYALSDEAVRKVGAAVREMAQRTLGWAAKEILSIQESPAVSKETVMMEFIARLRSLAGQEER